MNLENEYIVLGGLLSEEININQIGRASCRERVFRAV